MKYSKRLLAAVIAGTFAVSAHAGDMKAKDKASAETSATAEFTGDAHDAWIDGKLEATYLMNRGLSAFDIETRVENGTVLLTGAVESETQKQLAKEIALTIDGVQSVENNLVVKEDAQKRDATDEPTFADRVEDATVAATLKSKLLLNGEISGLDIDVDVTNRTAILNGTVDNESQAELAEYIARNTDGVRSVENRLKIQS